MSLDPKAAHHQGERNGLFQGKSRQRFDKAAIQGSLRGAEVRRQKKPRYGMFGLAQAVVLERERRGGLPCKGAGKEGFLPGFVCRRACREDRSGVHLTKVEMFRVEDEKTGVITPVVSTSGRQKSPVRTVKRPENRLIVRNGRGGEKVRRGCEEEEEEKERKNYLQQKGLHPRRALVAMGDRLPESFRFRDLQGGVARRSTVPHRIP